MTRRTPRPVTVAWEDDGALGTFTWAVLERLLDTSPLRIEVISGASAGAMKAAIVAQGLAIGGAQEVKRQLEAFWRRVATEAHRGRMWVPETSLLLRISDSPCRFKHADTTGAR